MTKDEINTIVDEAKQGSQRAFNSLYNHFKSNVWFTIFNIVKNTDVTDDLTSIVFTKAYYKLESYVNHISFEMWLKTIAVNTSIDYIRKTKKEQLNNYIDNEESNIQLEGSCKSPEEEMILKEKVELVQQIIPTLKKKYRDLLIARSNGLSYKEIGNQFGLNEFAVKSDLNKARSVLKKRLNKY